MTAVGTRDIILGSKKKKKTRRFSVKKISRRVQFVCANHTIRDSLGYYCTKCFIKKKKKTTSRRVIYLYINIAIKNRMIKRYWSIILSGRSTLKLIYGDANAQDSIRHLTTLVLYNCRFFVFVVFITFDTFNFPICFAWR